MRQRFAKVMNGSSPVAWLGVNFWSRRGGPLMWGDYDGPTVSEELAVLADHGLTMTRSFLYWPQFHPEPDRIDEDLVARFGDFLDRHQALGMTTVPTFIVGHMSGENFDPAWRGERDLYADVWLVGRQAWFAGQIVKRFSAHPAVSGWLLSNEMPIYGRPPHLALPAAPRAQVTAWAQLLIDAVRAAGGHQPVSTGDGVWGIELTGVDNGYSVRDIAGLVDFLGPHVYKMETDVVRQNLAAGFVCELAGFTDLPIVLEEFGATTDFGSDENVGHYYRQTLHNSLLAGATGWIGWNNTDYDDMYTQDPYRHHPFEMHFGVTDSAGRPKSALLELEAFSKVLAQIDVTNCVRPDVDAALIVSSYIDSQYPFTTPEDKTAPIAALRQAYVATREADLGVTFVRESDGLPDDASLLIAPSTKQLTSPTWRRLGDLAEAGATVYVSYFAGTHDVQRGPWYGALSALFGVRHELRYGLANPIEDDAVTFTFVEDFGGLPATTTLTFRVGGSVNARSFLPVSPAGATVLAVDQHGRPALLLNRVGQGQVILSTYPIEFMAASLPAVNPEPTYRLYDALAVAAGIVRDVVIDDPRVMVGELDHIDGRRFIWLVSQSDEPVAIKPQLRQSARLVGLDDSERPAQLELPAYGVLVLRLEVAL